METRRRTICMDGDPQERGPPCDAADLIEGKVK